MAVDVTSVFAAYFARNRGPVPGDPDARPLPDYGVSASLDGAVVELVLTFRAGLAYCCFEPGCHLNLFEVNRWKWLRRELSRCGLEPPPQLVLHLKVIVEAGASFFDFSRPDSVRRGWYAFAAAEPHRYQEALVETVSPLK